MAVIVPNINATSPVGKRGASKIERLQNDIYREATDEREIES